MIFQAFRDEIIKYKNVGVVSHVRPDADAIGAQVALCAWLNMSGIKTNSYNDDYIPSYLKFIQEFNPVKSSDGIIKDKNDAFVVVDGNDLSRFGDAGEQIRRSGKPVFMIDHHPEPTDEFVISVSVVEASSTCELIYRLYRETNPGIIDKTVGTALYAGIMTDTGSFRFDSVSAETHLNISEIIKISGIEPSIIHQKVYDGKSMNQIALLGRVLSSISLHANNRIATMFVTSDTLSDLKCCYDDLEGMVNYGTSIEGVRASVLFNDRDGRIKLSLRSNSYIDVNIWARNFGGGGHVKASGAWHPGPLKKAIKEVVAIGEKQILSSDK